MKTIEIKHRWSGAVLFAYEVEDSDTHPIRTALVAGVRAGQDPNELREELAELTAQLADPDVLDWIGDEGRIAKLALLGVVSREIASPRPPADLRYAELNGAKLNGAELNGAELNRAELNRAELNPIREDIFEVLSHAPAEAPGLLAAIRDGRIDGSAYEGECACLVGTLANVRGCDHMDIPGLEPDSSRPAEKWFLALRPGLTPDNNQVAKITEGWVQEWIKQVEQTTA